MSLLNRKIIALLLCLCFLFGGSLRPILTFAAVGDAEYTDIEEDTTEEVNQVEQQYAGRIDELGDKLKALDEENKKLQASINDAKSDKEKKQAEVNAIAKQISITQEEIGALMERIGYLEGDIAKADKDIEKTQGNIKKKQGEIDHSYSILKKRLRASYMQDTASTLGLVLGAESFSDLLSRVEYVQRIAKHDRELLRNLTQQRKDFEAEKVKLQEEIAKLEEFKASVEADKSQTESKKATLGVQVTKAQGEVQNLVEQERAYKSDLANNQKIQEAAKAELDKIYREIEWSKNAYVGGAMAWPVPDYRVPGAGYVSCEFGPRFGGTDYHTGTDISGGGVLGHNIVAANDGTVVVANWAFTRGRGYGIYIIIDHGVNENGQSVSTLYGHCSNIVVKVGQEVKRGQVIGQVGSTGWSTGPHLHFEVRLDKKAVNARPYLFG